MTDRIAPALVGLTLLGLGLATLSPQNGVIPMTVADVEAWPERLKQVTVDDIRAVARKYFTQPAVTAIVRPG